MNHADKTIFDLDSIYIDPTSLSLWNEYKPTVENLKYEAFASKEDLKETLRELNITEYIIDGVYLYAERNPLLPSTDIPQPAYVGQVFIKEGFEETDIIGINDYLNLGKYGIIYIFSHGLKIGLNGEAITSMLGNYAFENADDTKNWFNAHEPYEPLYNNNGMWFYYYAYSPSNKLCWKYFFLTEHFFNASEQSYNDSIVFLANCYSANYKDIFINKGAKVYLGYVNSANIAWGREGAYKFFYYMMYGFEPKVPLSVNDSYLEIEKQGLTFDDKGDADSINDCELKLETKYPNTYFPVPTNIIVY